MKWTSAFSMTLGVACILAAPHIAQSTTANVGTLTCTLTAPESEVGNVGISIQAACSFKALDGRNARFVGSISRVGSVVQPTAKAVVAWSVNGPESVLPLSALEGRYIGALPTERTNADQPVLRGGQNTEIALVPLVGTTTAAVPPAALSVLELELSSMRS